MSAMPPGYDPLAGGPPQKPLPPGPDPSAYAPGSGPPSKDACNMAMLAHLLGALMGFIGPLIIWLIKKDESSFVDDQGKEALNFQLTMLIGYLVAGVVGGALSCVTFGLSSFLVLAPWILGLVYGIIGALAANKGEYYRYPITIRMIT